MLSSSQAGFRNKRSTAEQVEMMIMALEDAHLFKQNIFLLQADLTEAFDTISHTSGLAGWCYSVRALAEFKHHAVRRLRMPDKM
jgi:hypothetical protein